MEADYIKHQGDDGMKYAIYILGFLASYLGLGYIFIEHTIPMEIEHREAKAAQRCALYGGGYCDD